MSFLWYICFNKFFVEFYLSFVILFIFLFNLIFGRSLLVPLMSITEKLTNSSYIFLKILAFVVMSSFIISCYFCYSSVIFYKMFIFLLSILFFLFSKNEYFNNEILLLLLCTLLGFFFLLESDSLLMLFLSLELSSFGLYILLGLESSKTGSLESSLKYLFISAAGSVLFLLGTSWLYGLFGTVDLESLEKHFFYLFNEQAVGILYIGEEYLGFMLPSFIEVDYIGTSNYDNLYPMFQHIISGLFLIYISLLIKLGVAPFHFWIMDVYEGANWYILSILAVISKLPLFYVLITLSYKLGAHFEVFFGPMFQLLGLISLIFGSVGALFQINLKRWVGYSSVAHTGLVLLILNETGTSLVISTFYLVFYSLTLFFLLMSFFKIYPINLFKKFKLFFDLWSLNSSFPLYSLIIVSFIFSLAGIPPFFGFFGKLLLLLKLALFEDYFFLIFIVFISVLVMVYYLRFSHFLFFEKRKNYLKRAFLTTFNGISGYVIVIFFFFSILFIYFFWFFSGYGIL